MALARAAMAVRPALRKSTSVWVHRLLCMVCVCVFVSCLPRCCTTSVVAAVTVVSTAVAVVVAVGVGDVAVTLCTLC